MKSKLLAKEFTGGVITPNYNVKKRPEAQLWKDIISASIFFIVFCIIAFKL